MKSFLEIKIIRPLRKDQRYIFLVLLPFLILYAIYIISGAQNGFRKDEWRYIYYAKNLLAGFYSPSGSVFLWNGPGYPLLLAPLIAIGLPHAALKMLNALFLYFSGVFIYKSFKTRLSTKLSLWLTLIWCIYIPAFEMLKYMMTEPFVMFLVSALLFTCIKLFNDNKNKIRHLIIFSVLLAWLTLTKVLFGYVLLVLLIILPFWYLKDRRPVLIRGIQGVALALLFCMPYLFYTYQISGKIFYWSNAGGMQLYWMSTPYENEYGDWINFVSPISATKAEKAELNVRHGEVIAELYDYDTLFSGMSLDQLVVRSNLHQDDGFKKYAIENIKNSPGKYMLNCLYNSSRMLFNFPFSYKKKQGKIFQYALFHIPLLLLFLIGVLRYLKGQMKIPIEAKFLLLISFIYLAGSVLVSAYPRQFYIIFPWLLFAAGFVVHKILSKRKKIKKVNINT